MVRPDPLVVWQLNFKDISSVPAAPNGKQQHVVEVLDTVDMGTSILLGAQMRPDFTSETAPPRIRLRHLNYTRMAMVVHGVYAAVLAFARETR